MSKERVSWIQTDSKFKRAEGNISNIDVLPRGVYNVNYEMYEGWYLTKASDEFAFNFKIYDLQNGFVEHILQAYNGTKGNLGVLLNGLKGTGKTVVAKEIANQLGLPIIIVKPVTDNNVALMEYLSSFNFDCVLFFDEFEKYFDPKDNSILQIMDGVYSTEYRRVFLLTTNDTRINDNLLSRPSRVRYIKQFGNIGKDAVREYLNDNLNDKSLINDVISFVDSLTISTIDILKTITEDINIFGYDNFIENSNIFNVKKAKYYYWAKLISVKNRNDLPIKLFAKYIKDLETITPPSRYLLPEDEYAKAFEMYEKTRPSIDPMSRTIDTDKSIQSMKIGDAFGYWPEHNERIIDIDLDCHTIVTSRHDGDNRIEYYYIENIHAKPSIYDTYYQGVDSSYVSSPAPCDSDCGCDKELSCCCESAG